MTKTETTRQPQLDSLLLELLPADGTPVGNGALSTRFASEAQQAGVNPRPDDFTASRERLANGKTLVLEIKGEDSPQNVAKRDALKLWVETVNAKGGFGTWCWDVAFKPALVHDVLARHCGATEVLALAP